MTLTDQNNSGQNDHPELTTSGKIFAGVAEKRLVLQFVGDVRLVWCVALEEFCASWFEKSEVQKFYVDLSRAVNLDSTTLGVLAKLGILAKNKLGTEAEMYFVDSDIERLVSCMGFSKVFSIIDSSDAYKVDDESLHLLDYKDCCENVMRSSVIEAHKTLMDLNDENKKKFQGLVDSLEKSKG